MRCTKVPATIATALSKAKIEGPHYINFNISWNTTTLLYFTTLQFDSSAVMNLMKKVFKTQ